MKDISVQLESKYNQIQILKIKLTQAKIHGGDHVLFWVVLVGWLDVWFIVGRHNFSFLSLVCAFSLFCFPDAFLLDLTLSITSILPQSLFDGVRLRLENFSQIFLVRHSGGSNLVFHWSAAWPSWKTLWWGEISFQNFRSLNLELYFCVVFPSSIIMDTLTIWPARGFLQVKIHCEYQNFTRLPKYTKTRLWADQLFLVAVAEQNTSSFVESLLQPIAQKQKSYISKSLTTLSTSLTTLHFLMERF